MSIGLEVFAQASAEVYDAPDCDKDGDKFAVKTIGDSLLCVAFAGTHDLSDVLEDISAVPNIYGIHYGFYDVWKRFAPLVDEAINDAIMHNQACADFVFTGHSLGGAVAQLAAAKYKKSCVTFGSPKLWTLWNVGSRPLTHVRVRSKLDPVSMVPNLIYKTWETRLIEFDHVGIPSPESHRIVQYIKKSAGISVGTRFDKSSAYFS